MEMLKNGEWIIPTFNNQLRTDKPPLHYYCMMVSYALFGVTPFAARFFSAISGILLIILVYKNTKQLLGDSIAFYTSLVLLSSIQLTIQFHLAVPDPYLILFISWSLFSFFKGYHTDQKQLTWFYIASALGFLTKGLIAIVLPGLIILIFVAFTEGITWRFLKKLQIGKGLILFTLLALPWYAAVGFATDGEWLLGFFIEHNLERYTSTMEGHRGFPFAPLVILIAALLPFSVFLIQSLSLVWKERKEKPFLLFCGIVCFVFIVFFSFSRTILPSYPAPAIPFLAILIGHYLHRLVTNESKSGTNLWISFAVHVTISIALAAAAFIGLKQEETMSDLSSSLWIFMVLPLGAITGWYVFTRRNVSLFIYVWSGSWIIFGLLCFYFTYPLIDSKNPVKSSLSQIEQHHPDRRMVGYRIFNPAYVFALQKTIEVVDTPGGIQELSEKEKNILIITRGKYLKELPANLKVIYRGKDLFENHETVLLTN